MTDRTEALVFGDGRITKGAAQDIGQVTACKLKKGGTVCEEVACTLASTDYPMAAAMAAGTKYLVVSDDYMIPLDGDNLAYRRAV